MSRTVPSPLLPLPAFFEADADVAAGAEELAVSIALGIDRSFAVGELIDDDDDDGMTLSSDETEAGKVRLVTDRVL